MRFIRGASLKEAIARFHGNKATQKDPSRRALALRRLLRRFLDVCNAISYAHSRGVLHRDLKPGNIVLGHYGETLVVDWGLAKAVGHHLEPAATLQAERTLTPASGSDVQPTMMGQRLGTPAYMPPEQAAGRLDELGAPSDVYSLGATLYALLTGRPPFTGPDLPTLLRQVERGEFPRPRHVRPWIEPALEAVCLKAMARRPQDRYLSPRALAEDIEHWLADEPVTARRDSLWTRSWRWVRKHRTLSTTAAAVVLLSAAGLGIGLQRERFNARRIADERSEAERRLDQVMTSYEDYFTGFNEKMLLQRKLPKELLESLLAKPRAFYEQFTADLAAKPAPTVRERALLARGHDSLGRILIMLGRAVESKEQYEAAIRIWEILVSEEHGVPYLEDGLTYSYENLGVALAILGRTNEAEELFLKAITAYHRLMHEYPSADKYELNLTRSCNLLGNLLRDTGRFREAERVLSKAIELQERHVRDYPDNSSYRHTLAMSQNYLGAVRRDVGLLNRSTQRGKCIKQR
jgi:serine/threonine-protein kinase